MKPLVPVTMTLPAMGLLNALMRARCALWTGNEQARPSLGSLHCGVGGTK